MTTSSPLDNRPPTVEDDVNALSESLNSLSKLVIEDATLPVTLGHIADFAARAIPGADGAGLTLFQDGRADTVVFSAPFVRETDEVQYRMGEGPCITATRERRTVRSGYLAEDESFPAFGPLAAAIGVQSTLCLPLVDGLEVMGSINVYAHARDAFDDQATRLGELFAVPAAVTVRNAQALSQTQRLAAHLGTTLQKRAIDSAALGLPFATDKLTYRVDWSIEIEAHSAEEAVQTALDVLEDETSQARVFQVTHNLVDPRPARINATSVTEVIDLSPDELALPREAHARRSSDSPRLR